MYCFCVQVLHGLSWFEFYWCFLIIFAEQSLIQPFKRNYLQALGKKGRGKKKPLVLFLVISIDVRQFRLYIVLSLMAVVLTMC